MTTEDEKFLYGAVSSVGSPSYNTEDGTSRDSTPRPPHDWHAKAEEQLEPEAGDEYAKVTHPVPLACTITHIVRTSATETRSATPDMREGEYAPICSTLSSFSP